MRRVYAFAVIGYISARERASWTLRRHFDRYKSADRCLPPFHRSVSGWRLRRWPVSFSARGYSTRAILDTKIYVPTKSLAHSAGGSPTLLDTQVELCRLPVIIAASRSECRCLTPRKQGWCAPVLAHRSNGSNKGGIVCSALYRVLCIIVDLLFPYWCARPANPRTEVSHGRALSLHPRLLDRSSRIEERV
jgi:hypothetical protein